jgi:hypothetical protein
LTAEVYKKKGCFFYGCMAMLASALLLVATIVGLYFFGAYFLERIAENYTDDSPVEFPAPQVTKERAAELTKKVNEVLTALNDDKPFAPLKLESEDVNSIIYESPELKKFKNKIQLQIKEGKLTGAISLSNKDLGIELPKPRFITGTAIFDIGVKNNKATFSILSLKVKGKSLPGPLRGAIIGKNLLEMDNVPPSVKTMLGKLKSIEIRGNQMFIEGKKAL